MKIQGRILRAVALIAFAASGQAWASCASNSFVSDFLVTQTGLTWTYDYLMQNGCAPDHQQLLTDFYVPYFSDAGIANISVPALDNSTLPPTQWTYSIDPANDLFGLGPNAGVIDFKVVSSVQVSPTETLTGVGYYGSANFSFTSGFAPTKGPYALLQTLYDGGLYDSTKLTFGDPSIPGSPETIAALNAAATPEPQTGVLLALGLVIMAAFLWRRSWLRS